MFLRLKDQFSSRGSDRSSVCPSVVLLRVSDFTPVLILVPLIVAEVFNDPHFGVSTYLTERISEGPSNCIALVWLCIA